MYFISRLTTVWFVVIGLALVLFITGCDPYQVITFENQTSFPTKADIKSVPPDYFDTPRPNWYVPVKVIEAGEYLRIGSSFRDDRTIGTKRKYPVIAVTEMGEVVFYRIFTWDELHDMTWRVVIKAQK